MDMKPINENNYYKTTKFPQPHFAAIGHVNIDGTFDTYDNSTRNTMIPTLPTGMTVTKTGSSYKVTHKVNTNKYVVMVTPQHPVNSFYVTQTAVDFTVTFNTTAAFSFVIIKI